MSHKIVFLIKQCWLSSIAALLILTTVFGHLLWLIQLSVNDRHIWHYRTTRLLLTTDVENYLQTGSLKIKLSANMVSPQKGVQQQTTQEEF